MKIAVIGATGVLGRAAVTSLALAGHEVRGTARTPEGARAVTRHGAVAVAADVLDTGSLAGLLEGCDAVVNLATRVPVGLRLARPGAWRGNDRLRTLGSDNVAVAARAAGVRRIVQESVSIVYADQGDHWITERSPIEITAATEPVAVAETAVQEWSGGPRTGVVLRFGTVVGDDPATRFQLRMLSRGRPVGVGDPEAWAHIVHTDDIGPAIEAALHAPAGVYNVGAEPVRRGDLLAGLAAVAGASRDDVAPLFLGPVLRRVVGSRLEPMSRSLRVCSDHFAASTGWTPRHGSFDATWLSEVGRPLTGQHR